MSSTLRAHQVQNRNRHSAHIMYISDEIKSFGEIYFHQWIRSVEWFDILITRSLCLSRLDRKFWIKWVAWKFHIFQTPYLLLQWSDIIGRMVVWSRLVIGSKSTTFSQTILRNISDVMGLRVIVFFIIGFVYLQLMLFLLRFYGAWAFYRENVHQRAATEVKSLGFVLNFLQTNFSRQQRKEKSIN